MTLNLFFNDFLQVNAFVELVGFGTGIADPAFGV